MSRFSARAPSLSQGSRSAAKTSARPCTPSPSGRCAPLLAAASGSGEKVTSSTLFRLRTTRPTVSTKRAKGKDFSEKLPYDFTTAGREREARLHTATSEGELNCTISVQRLLQRMVPRCEWLLLALHASLYIMYGCPVSIFESRMCAHSARSRSTRRRVVPLFSAARYSASNSSLCVAARRGTVCGQKRDQSPS